MVKMLLSAVLSLALLVGAAIWETAYLNAEFGEVRAALGTLEAKTRDESALPDDARALQRLWEEKKKKLHAVIPHGDIAYIDYWLGEAEGCIQARLYEDALAKIEVLLVICRQLPQTYALTFENIFCHVIAL